MFSKSVFIKSIILFLLFVTTSSQAHPHTFFEVKPTLEIKDEFINKININWSIDEMTSMMLIMEFDHNSNGVIDEDENDFIYENYFLSLGNYGFYLYIIKDNQVIEFEPKNFKASIENNKVVYSFDVIEKLNLNNLKIKFHDELLYVGMILEKNFIKLEGNKSNDTEKLKEKIFGLS